LILLYKHLKQEGLVAVCGGRYLAVMILATAVTVTVNVPEQRNVVYMTVEDISAHPQYPHGTVMCSAK
jgi:hypothetical protein